jgi:hypothetical protein
LFPVSLKENICLDLTAFEIFIEPKVVATANNYSNIIFEENNVEEGNIK